MILESFEVSPRYSEDDLAKLMAGVIVNSDLLNMPKPAGLERAELKSAPRATCAPPNDCIRALPPG